MAYTKKTWADRVSEHPNRRLLSSTGTSNTYDVTRAEGAVTTEGDAFSAENMNDLESRISDGFANANSSSQVSITASSWTTGTSDYYTTVTVSGVTSTNKILVSPNNTASAIKLWNKWGIYASAQGTNTITFRAVKQPTESIIANILIIN